MKKKNLINLNPNKKDVQFSKLLGKNRKFKIKKEDFVVLTKENFFFHFLCSILNKKKRPRGKAPRSQKRYDFKKDEQPANAGFF